MQMPKRKPNRLQTCNYSSAGAYFITICTANHEWLLWRTGERYTRLRETDDIPLSEYGTVVNDAIRAIPSKYAGVRVDYYVVMPNHIHLIIVIQEADGRAMRAPTIPTIINQMKGYVTKQIGFSIWQKLYYDHIIRNHDEYEKITKYIIENPVKWQDDCYCISQNIRKPPIPTIP